MARLTAETLNIERLRNFVGQEIYNLGDRYFSLGKVKVDEITDLSAVGFVYDDRKFNTVEIKIRGGYLLFQCTCRYAARGLICEHGIATALAVREELHDFPPNRWKDQLTQALQQARNPPRRLRPHPYLLFFSLQGPSQAGLSWKINAYTLAVSALPEASRAMDGEWDNAALQALLEQNPELHYRLKSPFNALNPEACANCPLESVVLANLLLERARSSGYYFYGFPLTDYLALVESTHSPLFLGYQDDPLSKALQILEQPGDLLIDLERDAQGLHLAARVHVEGRFYSLKQGDVQIVSQSPFWALVDRYLFRMAEPARPDLLSGWLRTPEVLVPPRDEAEFLEKFYLPLARQLPLRGEDVTLEELQAEPQRRLYLSDSKGELKAALRFSYGDYEVPYEPSLPDESLLQKPDTWTLVAVLRQPEFEQAAFSALASSAYGLKRGPLSSNEGVFVLRARVDPVEFLLQSVPRLAKDGFEVYGEEKLKTARVNRATPRLSFNVTSGIDWFDVNVAITFGENEVALKDIRRILRKKERYVKLADGSIGVIPEEWLERYKHLFGLGKETADGVRLAPHHLALLDDLLAGADRARTDPGFERRRQKLRHVVEQGFAGIAHQELPIGFSGELRPYQQAGYEWLHFLREFEFGGCLADDMGLGKTVQALVFFQSLKEGVGGVTPPAQASLLVVPRSLLVNWQREAGPLHPQFAPAGVLRQGSHQRHPDLRRVRPGAHHLRRHAARRRGPAKVPASITCSGRIADHQEPPGARPPRPPACSRPAIAWC